VKQSGEFELRLAGGGVKVGMGSTSIRQQIQGMIGGRRYRLRFIYGAPTQMPFQVGGNLGPNEAMMRVNITEIKSNSTKTTTTIPFHWSDTIQSIPFPSAPYKQYESITEIVPELTLTATQPLEIVFQTGETGQPYYVILDQIQILDVTPLQQKGVVDQKQSSGGTAAAV